MPIKGLTDRRRLPRVGKVRLGVKGTAQSGAEYPKAVDYFVVHKDESTPTVSSEAFHEVYGDEPRELDVVFPSDDPGQWADANLKMYGASWGLGCRGDGEKARAKWDLEGDGKRPEGVENGTWANKNTKTWVYREIPCLDSGCPMQQGDKPQCKPVMNLQFLLPHVRGIGAWQVDTSSYNSISNLLSSVELIKSVTGGRIRGLPLKLRLVPKEVTPAGGAVKTKTVHVLDLSLPAMTLTELLGEASRLPQEALMLPPAIDDEEPPEDLFPTALAQPEDAEPPRAEAAEAMADLAAQEEAEKREAPPEKKEPPPQAAPDAAPTSQEKARQIVMEHAKGLGVKSWKELCEWLGLPSTDAAGVVAVFNHGWLDLAEERGLSSEEAAAIACRALDAVKKDLKAGTSLRDAVVAVSPASQLRKQEAPAETQSRLAH